MKNKPYAGHRTKASPRPHRPAIVKATPQTQPIPGTSPNNAGGFAFEIDDWGRFDRFLILGSEGGTFYVGERKLTKENASCVERCFELDGPRALKRISDVRLGGLAHRHDPAIFALAIGASSKTKDTRAACLRALPFICKNGTQLFHFMEFIKGMRGRGRAFQTAVQRWYNGRQAKDLAYQLIKYQSRDGWSHRDVLRLARPTPQTDEHKALYRWATKEHGDLKLIHLERLATRKSEALGIVSGFEHLKKAEDAEEAATLIRKYGLPRECVPTQLLKTAEVWDALLDHSGLTAIIRNLPQITNSGLLGTKSKAAWVADAVSDFERLRKEKIHPMTLLLAYATYSAGQSVMGSNAWKPNKIIVESLEDGFEKSFGCLDGSGKRILIGLDISGSMNSSLAGTFLSCREGSTAMAMVTARTEAHVRTMMFHTDGFIDLPFDLKRDSLKKVVQGTSGMPFGGTDCSLPMLTALQERQEYDAFIVYTDSETWAGEIHPMEALRRYRQKMDIAAKLIVVGMTATEFSIADPKDRSCMDVVGFDAGAPRIIEAFIRGW